MRKLSPTSLAKVRGTVVRYVAHSNQFDGASRHEEVPLVSIETLERFRQLTIRFLLTFSLDRLNALELCGAPRFIHFIDSVESVPRAVTVINTSPTATVAGDAERERDALSIVISPGIAQVVGRFKDI